MSEKGFKDYIENRTVADIMADYGEQRDEWQTLLSMENGRVVQFRHSNGRTFFCEKYSEEMGELSLPPEVSELLAGKTVEQQMRHYFITESPLTSETAYGEITKEKLCNSATSLCEYENVLMLILKDNLLVGAIIKGHCGNAALLPGNSVCIGCTSDDEGNATKNRENRVYLLFIPDIK